MTFRVMKREEIILVLVKFQIIHFLFYEDHILLIYPASLFNTFRVIVKIYIFN